MHKGEKKVIAVVGDLLFMAKINEAAKRAGVPVEYVTASKDVLEKAKAKPTLIILDLNLESAHPLELVQKLKANAETRGVSLIGYLSHIQGELKLKAQHAGCDQVMPRSAFSVNLPQILKRHAGMI